MQLIKINAVQPQAAEAAFTGGSQVFRLSVFYPFVGTGPVEAALRGNDQICRIRVQRLGYDLFTHSGPIGIRGIDKIESFVNEVIKEPEGGGLVHGPPEDVAAEDAREHCGSCAESEMRPA